MSDENNISLRLLGHEENFDWHFSLARTTAVMVALTIADDKDVASQGKKWSSGSRRLLGGGEGKGKHILSYSHLEQR